jgi:hypothetical protein
MDQQKFEQLKNLIIVAARRTFTCKNGYRDLVETKSWGEIIMWFDKYWSDVLLLSKNDGFRFWTEVYPMYKEEFNRCGIWFNENADSGKAIVTEGAHTFRGNATVWAYNQSKVELHDNVRCTANNQSFVDCYDYTQVMLLDQSECHAYVRSKVNAGGESVVDAYDACTITAGDRSTVIAHSWNQITAVGEAKVLAPSKYKIKILGQAKLTLKKPEEL